MLSFPEFIRLGSDQWHVQQNILARWFLRIIGPLGMHARIRNTRVINALESNDLNHTRVLDIGSGHGYILYWLARHYPTAQFEGIEMDKRQVDECQQIVKESNISNLAFRQGTFEDLPDESQYDAVITIDVLEHVPDDVGMLRKITRILKPGGMAVIHVPLRHQLQQRIIPAFHEHTIDDHVRDEYLPEEISAKTEQAGLKLQNLTYGFGPWGELAFELNYLFWRRPPLRAAMALITLPISLVAGYYDTRAHLSKGNSILLKAQKPKFT